MIRHRFPLSVFAALLLAVVCVCTAPSASAQASKASDAGTADKITPQTRMLVIRSLQSERVFARILFPQGDKAIKIKNGVVSPSDMVIAQQVSEYGAAAKPGDRCVITDVLIKEKEIAIDINGGAKKKQKWYQHIEIGGAGGGTSPIPGGPSPQSLDAHGATVVLEFDKYVPEMTGDQVRALLAPVFDFKALTQAEAYEKTLPPKVQEAIKDHKVLVGMDKEMVMYAKGRPPQKIRDKDDKGQDYEEWIYGTPPEEVDFVRFRGNEVARLEIMTVDGQKIVRTEKEVDLQSREAELAQQQQPKTLSPTTRPANAPTLRRPGEEVEYPTTSDQRTSRPNDGTSSPNGTSCPDPTCANPQTIPPPIPPNGVPPTSPTSGPPHAVPSQ
jgi:hypothetical protein